MMYQQTIDKIKEVIEDLRPNMQMDGGDFEFVNYEDGMVYVRLHGSCLGCSATTESIKSFLEQRLKEQVSEINEVVIVSSE